jgi:hypothetical protein
MLNRNASSCLAVRNSAEWSLPKLTIPRWNRLAASITGILRDFWKLQTVFLHDFSVCDGVADVEVFYAVLELRSDLDANDSTFEWVSCEFGTPEFSSNEIHAIQLARKGSAGDSSTGPFAKIAWMDDLFSWAIPELSKHGIELTGEFRQIDGGPHKSLVKLESSQSPVWFKAVDPSATREYGIITALGNERPGFFPRILACKEDWNAWIAEDAGSPLDSDLNIQDWGAAVSALAQLQIAFMSQGEGLLRIGCQDWGVATIQNRIEPFVESMTRSMEQQQKVPPMRLSPQQLTELGQSLHLACEQLLALGVPDSLVLSDLSPCNILIRNGRCSFVDLADACVGNPLLSFQHLLDWLHTYHPDLDCWHEHLEHIYQAEWSRVLSASQISELAKLQKPLAVLIHAMGANGWQGRGGRLDEIEAQYLRSLTRTLWKRMADWRGTVPALTLRP